jgi:hypothetical protein
MGTAAVFSISAYREKIIGMTRDGFPNNLEYIAFECWKIAKELRVLTKWKREDKETVKTVMEALVSKHKDWLFLDDPRNPEWVEHSLIMSIKNKVFSHYNGYWDYKTNSKIMKDL